MDEPAGQERVEMVTVLGWIWTAIGVFLTLAAVVGLTAWVGMLSFLPEGEFERDFEHAWQQADGGEMLPGGAVMGWIFGHFDLVMGAQLAGCVAVLVGGIFLLRRRAWARALLEGLSWLGLASMVASTVLMAVVFQEFFGDLQPAPGEEGVVGFFQGFFWVAMAMNLLFYGAPLAVLLYFLRHPAVRRAVASGAGAAAAEQ